MVKSSEKISDVAMKQHTLYMREWRKKNPEKVKQINFNWYHRHEELSSKKHKLYYQLHKEEIKQRVRDREYMIMRAKKWAEENPDKKRVIELNRRYKD